MGTLGNIISVAIGCALLLGVSVLHAWLRYQYDKMVTKEALKEFHNKKK